MMSEDKRSRLREAYLRLKSYIVPAREEVHWVVGEEAIEEKPRSDVKPLASYFSDFATFWASVRRRFFRILAALVAVADLALGILLLSNVWYYNLILYAYLVPSFIITVHYLRLTRNS